MKLSLSIFLLIICIVFEQPRISSLLALIFPGEYTHLFSFLLPVILVISLILIDAKRKFTRFVLSASFFIILLLSYYNTVMNSFRQSEVIKDQSLQSLYTDKSEKQSLLIGKLELKPCYAPKIGSEKYDSEMSYYRHCLGVQENDKKEFEKNQSIIAAQVEDLSKRILAIESVGPDYTLAFSQAILGFFLSLILGVVSGFTANLISIEIKDMASTTEEHPVLKHIYQGKTYREVSELTGMSVGSIHSMIRNSKKNRLNKNEQRLNKTEQRLNKTEHKIKAIEHSFFDHAILNKIQKFFIGA